MNEPTRMHHGPLHDEFGEPVNDPNGGPADTGTTNEEHECECPFPWWWLLFAAAAGGGVGYAVGRKEKKSKQDELSLP